MYIILFNCDQRCITPSGDRWGELPSWLALGPSPTCSLVSQGLFPAGTLPYQDPTHGPARKSLWLKRSVVWIWAIAIHQCGQKNNAIPFGLHADLCHQGQSVLAPQISVSQKSKPRHSKARITWRLATTCEMGGKCPQSTATLQWLNWRSGDEDTKHNDFTKILPMHRCCTLCCTYFIDVHVHRCW